MRNTLITLIAIFLLAASALAEWSTFHGSPRLTGYADIEFPDKPAKLWRFKTDSEVIHAPVTGAGLIFCVSDKGTLYAVDLEGKEKWSRKSTVKNEYFPGAPVFVNGTVAIASDEGVIYVFDAITGDRKWKNAIKDMTIKSSLNWYSDKGKYQLIAMADADGIVHCLDLENGTLLKKFDETMRTDGTPAVGQKKIVFGNCESALYVFSMDDKSEGLLELGENGQVAAGAAYLDDTVYVGTHGGSLISVNEPDLKVNWTNEDSKHDILKTPAVDSDNVLFASGGGMVFCAERKTGITKWKFDTRGTPAGVVVVKDKAITTADGKVFVLNLKDGSVLWSKEIGDEASAPSIIGNMLVVGSDDNCITAFGKGGKQP